MQADFDSMERGKSRLFYSLNRSLSIVLNRVDSVMHSGMVTNPLGRNYWQKGQPQFWDVHRADNF